MKKNSVEIKAAINEAKTRAKEIINLAKTEVRELTDEEEKEVNELKETIEEKKRELEELEKELKSYDELIEDEEERECDEDEKIEKNTRNKKMKTQNSLVKEIRKAMNSNEKSFKFNAETRTMQVTGESGVHDDVVETEIQGILEPLYANSVLSKLGVRWYTGLPMGDIQIPIMGKGSCGWKGEVEAAGATGNTFTTVKLQPKRLTAYVDISKQLLVQDTIGVEMAIRRDIVNAMNDQLEATIFGGAAGTTDKPAGIFYGVTPTTISSYVNLCEFESGLDDANIGSERKYLLGNGAKAGLRSMIKGTNATGMVMEGNDVDGTPAFNTSNVNGGVAHKYDLAYGDWSALCVASWGDLDITVDPYTQAVNGCVRLTINAFFDATISREAALAFGTVDVE